MKTLKCDYYSSTQCCNLCFCILIQFFRSFPCYVVFTCFHFFRSLSFAEPDPYHLTPGEWATRRASAWPPPGGAPRLTGEFDILIPIARPKRTRVFNLSYFRVYDFFFSFSLRINCTKPVMCYQVLCGHRT
jgi:hypothetical protein